MTELADMFADLEDPRAVNARHQYLHDIRVIALCAIVCGGETCTDGELFGHAKRNFLESFLPLANGIPGYDTFSRVLGQLDPEAFQQWFWGSYSSLLKAVRGMAADGKTLRRSYWSATADH